MKKIALFMSALALMVFTSCDQNNDGGTDLDNVIEDGFFVAGPATGSDDLEAKFMMTAGFNEVTKAARDGMYEKYIILQEGKDFYLTLNEAGESLRYSADLQDVDLETRKDEAAYADNPHIVIRKGELVEGPEAPAMRVNKTGLYHIVLDLNKAEDLEFPQIIIVPCEFMLKGGIGDKTMELTVDGDKYIYTYTGTGHQDASNFKFACCNGWKITLDVDGLVKAETSLGVGLQPNGGDIPLNPGDDIQIILTFQAASGDHSNSFSYKFVNVLEKYGPEDFTVGLSGKLHSAVAEWATPSGATKGVYNAAESNANTETYVYEVTGCPIKKGAEFKMRRDGDWIGGGASYLKIEGVTVTGSDNLTFGGETGLYNVKITLVWNGTSTQSYTAVFTRTGDAPAEAAKDPKALVLGVSGSINEWKDPSGATQAAFVSVDGGVYTYKISGLVLAAGDQLKFRFDGSWEGVGFAPLTGITFAGSDNFEVTEAAAGTYDVVMTFKWDAGTESVSDKTIAFTKK